MVEENILIENAVQFSEEGKYQQAIDLLENIESPEHPGEINYYLGVWFFKVGEADKGRDAFQRSIHDVTSPFAHRSLLNLAAICKRHSDRIEQVAGFKLLERALELTIQHKWMDKQEQTINKMARYILELNLFDSIESTEIGMSWDEFNKNLVSLDRTNKLTKDGLIAVLTALLNFYYLHKTDKAFHYLIRAIDIFKADAQMILFITDLLEKIISGATMKFEQADRFHKSTQEQQDLKRLIDVGTALNSEFDLDKLLELVVDNIIEITSAERGFLMLAENSDLQFRIARDCKKDTLSPTDFMISQTVTKSVFETGNPILITDVEHGSSWILTRSVLDLQLKSMLCVPLKTTDKIIGVIYVDNAIQSSQFGQHELDLLTTLAGQTTIAIENARMYGQMEELVEERTSELLQANKDLRESEEKFRQLADHSEDIIWIWSPDAEIHYINPAYEKFTGSSPDMIYADSSTVVKMVHYDDRAAFGQALLDIMAGQYRKMDLRVEHKDGTLFHMEGWGSAIRDQKGKVIRCIGIWRDVTKRVQLVQHLDELAITDPLTKIYNRRFFFDIANKEEARAKRSGTSLSVILIDIDHFKMVNDTYGHIMGDKILVNTAHVCKANLREGDIFARYGGEEFVILLHDSNADAALKTAEKLRQLVANDVVHFGEKKVNVQISLGVVSGKMTGDIKITELLDRADQALYQSKENGRNQVTVWKEKI